MALPQIPAAPLPNFPALSACKRRRYNGVSEEVDSLAAALRPPPAKRLAWGLRRHRSQRTPILDAAPAAASPTTTLTELEEEEEEEEAAAEAIALLSVMPVSLRLDIGSAYVPKKGSGDDAHFVGENAFGIADGVGGWTKRGVDAGVFSRQLMSLAKAELEGTPGGGGAAAVSPVLLVEKALAGTTARGTSTACIALLRGGALVAANLGDSGFLVVRRGTVVYHTPVQQKAFNKPYQVGRASGADAPSCAERISVEVGPGDVVVAGSDGLFDNLFDDEIADLVVRSSGCRYGPEALSRAVAAAAVGRSRNERCRTPFSVGSAAAGKAHAGGKVDDITVVVAKVTL